MKKLTVLFLLIFCVSGYSQTPPDAPLLPQNWVNKMGIGHWWIFTIPPAPNTNITTDYSDKILDSLQNKFCLNGGRLHWVVESPHYSSYDNNDEIPQSTIDFVGNIIDDFMQRDMAICLSIQFNNPNTIKDGLSQDLRTRMKNNWKKISQSFKGKSHNLAMSPVIEFHGWQNLGNPARQDSLNVLYDELTTIYREDNPTRIMSYKPWGAAKRAEFNTLDYPFGNDPLPNQGQDFYYVSAFSGSAGLGDWQNWTPTMSQQDLDALHFQTINGGSSNANNVWGIRAALQHRTDTGIPFWMDHWRPNYHKNYGTPQQWTMEQNMAYVDFFINKIKEIGSAGAFFQTRTFWNEQTDDLIRLTNNATDLDIMSVMFMDYLQTNCQNLSVSDNTNNLLNVYPTLTNDKIIIEGFSLPYANKIKIYSIFGRDFSDKIDFQIIDQSKIKVGIKSLKRGIYFLKVNKRTFKIVKV